MYFRIFISFVFMRIILSKYDTVYTSYVYHIASFLGFCITFTHNKIKNCKFKILLLHVSKSIFLTLPLVKM
jgi:hypothetical protein